MAMREYLDPVDLRRLGFEALVAALGWVLTLRSARSLPVCVAAAASILLAWLVAPSLPGTGQGPKYDLADGYVNQVQPLLKKYCLECHSAKVKKGSLDLARFASLAEV